MKTKWQEYMRSVDHSGARFDLLTVVSRSHKDKNGRVIWLCRCDCEGQVERAIGDLNQNKKRGSVSSCGCARRVQIVDGKKLCGSCGDTKPLSEFSSDKHRSTGFCSSCKDCQREYADKNRDMIRARNRSNYHKDPFTAGKRSNQWSKNNRSKRRKIEKTWRDNNPGYATHRAAARRSAKSQATPGWFEKEKVAAIYAEAARLTNETGVKWTVDHIVPLTSDLVCGLHCLDNLGLLTLSNNSSKRNYYWPDMP